MLTRPHGLLRWLWPCLTFGRLVMTQETVTLKKIPGKEKQTDGQKTSFKHISVVERYF